MNNALTSVASVVFFCIWYFFDLYYATGFLIAFFALKIAICLLIKVPIPKMDWFTAILVIAFGGLTLLLQDKTFIQLKTSIVYLLLAAIFLISELLFSKNLLRAIPNIDTVVPLSDANWRKATLLLSAYFALISLVNYVVLKTYSEAVWITVKTFVFPVCHIVFFIALFATMTNYEKRHLAEHYDK